MSEMTQRRGSSAREELQQLGLSTKKDAPPFDALWNEARRRVAVRPKPVVLFARRAAWAGLAAVVAVLVLVTMRREPQLSDQEALQIARNISSWNAPSDSWSSASYSATSKGVPDLAIESITLPDSNGQSPSNGGQAEEVVQ